MTVGAIGASAKSAAAPPGWPGDGRVPRQHGAGVPLRVEVDHQGAQAALHAGESEVADERRLPHSPLLVGHRDDAHAGPQFDASACS